ncbi:PspC domain-containing protein [Jejudonia soesokkakensis]|uniref:PspC domain-containing protein n=1 Tax=Jejudonia soesokkakensis TaxID=1323432 RepID=A0ABW2MXN0_9FLAO
MKKTVNINLAGTFFHIDEDAFGKLQRYLQAIKRSLTEPQGSDEIMRDIEARIAELFSEKVETTSQVISLKELDEVIAVMGQPEDYSVDEELFEETPPAASHHRRYDTSYKQLFRDVDNKFISGVSSGLAHYLRIDALWVRLIWILLTFITSGLAIPVYILMWILVPAAVTTSDKLKMTGEPINISNIEKKFKEGYESVADKVKNADYDKYGQKVKSGASGFFSGLGNVLLVVLKIFVKLFGLFLIFVAISVLLGLVVGLFTLGSLDLWGSGEVMDYVSAVIETSTTPVWLISLLAFLAISIPFFALLILGLKIMFNNLKSIGTPAKIILAVLWFLSIIGILIFGVRMTTEKAYDNSVISERTLNIKAGDTLTLYMNANKLYDNEVYRNSGFEIKYNDAEDKVIYSNDIRLIVKSTRDSIAKLSVEKLAEGNSFLNAKKRAEAIDYTYSFENNSLRLDGYFITDLENRFRDQEVEIIVYLPIGTVLFADSTTKSFHRNYSSSGDILNVGDEEYHLLILDKETQCLDCPESEEVEENTEASESDADPENTTQNQTWEQEVESSFDDDTTSEASAVKDTLTIKTETNENI